MARASYIEALTGGLPTDIRRVFRQVADYFFSNIRYGVPADKARAENLQAYAFSTRTASSTSEFVISHNLGRIPYLLTPCLRLDQAGEQLVNLEVSRKADATNLYLKSTSTGASVRFWVEVP